MPKPYRESEPNNARRRRARGNQIPADYTSIDSALLQQVIATITGSGGAVQFGYTRDGGGYAIRLLGDGEPYTEYLRPSDDVVAYFEGLIRDWTDETPTPLSSVKK